MPIQADIIPPPSPLLMPLCKAIDRGCTSSCHVSFRSSANGALLFLIKFLDESLLKQDAVPLVGKKW